MENQNTTVYINGRIFTSNEAQPYADAMVVKDGVIAWVGRSADLADRPDLSNLPDPPGSAGLPDSCNPSDLSNPWDRAGQGAVRTVDLAGKRVLPGFVDAHMHAGMLAELSKQISCLPPEIHSIAELTEEIGRVRKAQGPGKWIQGWGCDEGKLAEKRLPNRYDLDRACADAPVSIVRTCAHIRCVNSKALELAGIDRNTPDPQGGEIDRDEKGEPTGILRENARNLVTEIIPPLTGESLIGNIVDVGRMLASQGVTAMTDMGDLNGGDHYGHFLEAARRGLKQQVAVYYMWDYFAHDPDFKIPSARLQKDQQIRIGGLKLIGDGSVSGRTAWMDRPYRSGDDEYGMPVCSDELLESAIAFCKENRCQLSMHAMGAKAIRRIVDRVWDEKPWTDGNTPFLRVEHAADPTEESLAKAAEKGVGFVMQPIFLYAEIETYLKILGPSWTRRTYPVKTMLEKGVRLCFSTDAPATSWAVPSDPMPCLKGAVTRRAYDGTDCGPQERVDIETAIRLYTKYSAEIAGFTGIGQLKPGYKADFLVLDRDILEIPSEEIDRVAVEKTYIAGDCVYERS